MEVGEISTESELEESARKESVRRTTSVIHYLVNHGNIKQYYYELKYLRDDSKLLDLIGRAMKDLAVLKRDKEEQARITQYVREPDSADVTEILGFYHRLGKRFTALLAAQVVAACPLCWRRD